MNTADCIAVPHDPLLYQTPLPFVRTFYPFGFAATIETNSEHIMQAAGDLWERFEKTSDAPAVQLRFAISESDSDYTPPASLPRGQGHLITTVHDASNFAVSDLRGGFAFGWFTPRVASNQARFRYHFLEPHVYLLLQSQHLTPIHAGCVSLYGSGILLCGDSEAGKTTLSYACARRRWTYTSDDASHLIRRGSDRMISGNPYQIRFRPHARELFPELRAFPLQDRPNGKPSIEVDTKLLDMDVSVRARAEYAVFLKRTSGGPQLLAKYDKCEALQRLASVITVGDEGVREEQRESLHRLLGMPVYELHYFSLDWAEQRLRSLIENGK